MEELSVQPSASTDRSAGLVTPFSLLNMPKPLSKSTSASGCCVGDTCHRCGGLIAPLDLEEMREDNIGVYACAMIHEDTKNMVSSACDSNVAITRNMRDANLRFEIPSSLEVWKRQCALRSKSIFDDYRELSAVVSNHHETIIRRWQKKTLKQRTRMIEEAWPGNELPVERPDWSVVNKMHVHGVSMVLGRTKPSDLVVPEAFDLNTYLHPFINVAELTERKALPTFLLARASNHPAVFVSADWHAMSIGWDLELLAIETVELVPYITQFRKASDWKDYVSAKRFSGSIIDLAERHCLHFPTATFFLLESQKRIMSFLCACTRLILHDGALQVCSSPALPLKGCDALENGQNSLDVLQWESPYHWKSGSGCKVMDEVILARRDYYVDLLRSLREDPGFYSDHMSSLYEGLDLSKLDVAVQSETISVELISLLGLGEQWMLLCERYTEQYQAALLRADPAGGSEASAAGDATALSKLRSDLSTLLSKLWATVEYQASKCGTRHSQWSAFVSHHPDMGIVEIQRVKESEVGLRRLIRSLSSTPGLSPASFINAGDELRRFVEHGAGRFIPSRGALLLIAGEISQVSACLRQLDMKITELGSTEIPLFQIYRALTEEMSSSPSWFVAFKSDLFRIIRSNGTLQSQAFDYPVRKRKTFASVKTMQQAERNLNAFWKQVVQLLNRKEAKCSKVAALLASGCEPIQTPDYHVDPKPGLLQSLPMADMYFDLQYRTEQTLQNDLPKGVGMRKMLTKARINTENAAPQHEIDRLSALSLEVPPVETISSRIVVDKGALAVFRTLFTTPKDDRDSGEIPWVKFLHAMTSAGFAAQKLQGSAWHFRPVTQGLNRSIHFHEPHPASKIRFFVAKAFGRRLNRVYGWTAETFVLALKDNTA